MTGEPTVRHIGPADAAWSIVETRIPETIGFVPSMRCFPRTWRASPPIWSADSRLRAVRVESVAFGERFDAQVAADREENWLLQLLSPDFVDWLTAKPQADFGFEIHEGWLRCLAPGPSPATTPSGCWPSRGGSPSGCGRRRWSRRASASASSAPASRSGSSAPSPRSRSTRPRRTREPPRGRSGRWRRAIRASTSSRSAAS